MQISKDWQTADEILKNLSRLEKELVKPMDVINIGKVPQNEATQYSSVGGISPHCN